MSNKTKPTMLSIVFDWNFSIDTLGYKRKLIIQHGESHPSSPIFLDFNFFCELQESDRTCIREGNGVVGHRFKCRKSYRGTPPPFKLGTGEWTFINDVTQINSIQNRPPTVGQNHRCCAMNNQGPKYFINLLEESFQRQPIAHFWCWWLNLREVTFVVLMMSKKRNCNF